MAACDTCQQNYHLHYFKPPLQRPPKKSKQYGCEDGVRHVPAVLPPALLQPAAAAPAQEEQAVRLLSSVTSHDSDGGVRHVPVVLPPALPQPAAAAPA
ncbi:unnamed protein product [Parnassius apollo]|uniref:(apollo) hypothetical protein n=1 Tax=Parnassius apollo TaxID=110799 RepID=A0A8S3X2A7_PARAO|nr:unnamed protein product [Parnassius apollo]